MTTHHTDSDIEFVETSLRLTKRHVKLAEALAAGLALIAYTVIVLTVVVIADHALTGGLSARMRLFVRWAYVVGAVGMLVWLAISPLVRRINNLYAARVIEHRYPEFRNSVVSALQLAWRGDLPGSMRSALTSKAAVDLAATDLWAVIDKRSIRRMGVAGGGALALFMLYALLAPKPVWPSIRRALGFELPVPTRTQIVIEEPASDCEVLVGSPVRMAARVTGRRPNEASVRFSFDGGTTWLPDQRLLLSPPPTVAAAGARERQRWRAVKPGRQVQQTTAYQFVAGDARSEIRTLRVRAYPQVGEVSIRCEYPSYTGIAPIEKEGGNVAAVIGTRVTVRILTSTPAEPPLMLRFGKTERGRLLVQPADNTAMRFEGRFRVEVDDEYTIDYRDRYGTRNRDPIAWKVKAIPDEPPRVELEAPPDGIELSPTDSMRLACRVSDDFGLTDAVLEYRRADGRTADSIPLVGSRTRVIRVIPIERSIPLSRMEAQAGEQITWWVTVRDNRYNMRGDPASQVARSQERQILIREKAEPDKPDEPTSRPSKQTTRKTKRRTIGRPDAEGDDGSKTSAESDESSDGDESGQGSVSSMPAGDHGDSKSSGTPPAEDLEGFVEGHDRELDALEKLLKGDSNAKGGDGSASKSEQDGPPDSQARATDSKVVPGGDEKAYAATGGKGEGEGSSQEADKINAKKGDADGGQRRKGDADDKADDKGGDGSGEGPGRSTEGSDRKQDEAQSDSGQGEGEGKNASNQSKGGEKDGASKGESRSGDESAKEQDGSTGDPTSDGSGSDSTSDQGKTDKGHQSDKGESESAGQSEDESGGQSSEGSKESSSKSGQEQDKGESATGEQQTESGSGEEQSDKSAESDRKAEADAKGESPPGESEADSESAKDEGGKFIESAQEQQGSGTGEKESKGQSDKGEAESSDQVQEKGESKGKSEEGESQAGQGEGQSESGKAEGGSGEGQGRGQGEGEGEGEAETQSKGKGGGGGAEDPLTTGGSPSSMPTTRPEMEGDDSPIATRQKGSTRSTTVHRAERIVSELERQLRGGRIDPELLRELGWTPKQAQQFVRKFREIKERTPTADVPADSSTRLESATTSQPGDDRRRESAGRDRGLHGTVVIDQRDADKVNQLLEMRRQQVSPDDRPFLEAYYKSVATFRPATPTTGRAKPANDQGRDRKGAK